MGAQMSLLLASYEPKVKAVLAMVPPYVDQPDSPVAPREHTARINHASVLLLAAKNDPHTSMVQNQHLFETITSKKKNVVYFDSGHVLPDTYINEALSYIDQQSTGQTADRHE